MKIIFDNIIYSLQKSGGISVLWTELLRNIWHNKAFQSSVIEFKNADKNIFYSSLNLDNFKRKYYNKDIRIERYKNPKLGINEKYIFCSSYYRYSKDKKAVNITIVHDFTYEYYGKGIAQKIHSYQKNKAIQNSDGIICISENTKKDVMKFVPNVDEKKIRVIHNGVSDDFFKINEKINLSLVKKNIEFLNEKKIVLFIGSRASYKNFDITVKAISALKDETFHFIIVGAELTKKERDFVDEFLKENQYSVLTGLSNKELNILYNLSFVLVYPSSYEGFGIPILESMKAGLPVICLNRSSIPEVAGNAGVYIEKTSPEAIQEKILALCDENYRNSIIENGYIQSSYFSWNKTMEEYIHFFEKTYNVINK